MCFKCPTLFYCFYCLQFIQITAMTLRTKRICWKPLVTLWHPAFFEACDYFRVLMILPWELKRSLGMQNSSHSGERFRATQICFPSHLHIWWYLYMILGGGDHIYIYMLRAAQAAHCIDDTQFVWSGFAGTNGSCGSHKKALGGAGEEGSWEDVHRRLNHVEWLKSHDVMGKQKFRYG